MEEVLQDARYAVRALVNAPGFALVTVLTLALGIGANIAMFSVINSVLLRPLPLGDPSRLGIVSAEDVKTHSTVGASWTKFQEVRAQNEVFQNIGAYVQREFTFSDGINPEQVNGARVTAGFFQLLGVQPIRGRDLLPSEDVENSAPVAVVTYGFWQRRLAGDRVVIGKTMKLEGRDTVITGVLPRNFKFQFADREPQVFLSSVFTPGALTAAQIHRGAGFLQYVVRLKPGVTFARAQSALETINARYRQEFGSYADSAKYSLRLVPLGQDLIGDIRPALLVLMGTVTLVLLIACANIAHLLLARATARKREIAVRLALGASPMRLIQQFLTESLVLALLGCGLAIALAEAGIRVLTARGPSNIPRLSDSGIDGTVLLFAVAVSCVTAVLFGIAPALRSARININEALRYGKTSGLEGSRIQSLLASSETAIAMALLIASGLLIQSLAKMQAVDPGFNPQNVLTAHIALPREKYPQAFEQKAFFTQLLHKLQMQPGIKAAGAISYLPMTGSNYGFFFYVEGSSSLGGGRDPVISVRHVSTDYFRAMTIPLRAGRFFNEQDNEQSRPVAIINETAARRYFSGKNPVGQSLASSGDHIMREIVGVVSDVKFDGPARPGEEELYMPYQQVPWSSMTIVLQSNLGPDRIIAALRHEVNLLDPDQPVAEVRPMQSIVAGSMTQQRFTTSLLGVFALLAVSMSCVGLYGVVAFFVTRRTREFGIRMALGAHRANVARQVIGQGAKII
jgi:ABC-type antimicrobial peptide transport system, permease component